MLMWVSACVCYSSKELTCIEYESFSSFGKFELSNELQPGMHLAAALDLSKCCNKWTALDVRLCVSVCDVYVHVYVCVCVCVCVRERTSSRVLYFLVLIVAICINAREKNMWKVLWLTRCFQLHWKLNNGLFRQEALYRYYNTTHTHTHTYTHTHTHINSARIIYIRNDHIRSIDKSYHLKEKNNQTHKEVLSLTHTHTHTHTYTHTHMHTPHTLYSA